MPRLRGNGFINIRAWVEEHHGVDAWETLLRALDRADRDDLRDLRPAAWYPLSLQARLLRLIDARWGDADLRLARHIGRDQATRDLDHGVLTWLFRLFPPAILVANMDVVWRRFHDSGRWSSVTRGGLTTITVYDWQSDDPANCMDVEGYIEYVAQRMSRTPGSLRQTRCRHLAGDVCEWVYDEPLDGRIPVPRALPDVDDVLAIGRELTQVNTPEAIVEAIVAILRSVLPRDASAALWGWDGATGQARMLWSRGEPTDQPAHCFVLESAGRTFARLEVETLAGPRRAEILAALERLSPWFGMALARVEAGGSRASTPEIPIAAPDAMGVVSSRWRLTPRQAEVLRGVIDGRTNKEIAAALGCAEATVEVHVTALYRKSGVSNRTGLVRAVLSEPGASPTAPTGR